MDIYLNGQFVPHEQATVPIDDAGLQHAVGLFETMAVRHGRAFRLRQHVDRLIGSTQALGLSRDLESDSLADAVTSTIEHNGIEDARVRLTVTAGSVSLLKPDGSPPTPTVMVVATPAMTYDPAYFEHGIRVLVTPPMANPFDPSAGHKTLSYWSRLRTLRQAAEAGAGEAIWLNVTNHLASGAISNVFLVKDGRLLTPIARGEEQQGALPAPVLPGVTRAAVIEQAHNEGIEVERRMLSVDDLLGADEAFLTNSGWQVLPVTSVEKANIGDGSVGELTRRLREGVLKLIEDETATR